MVLDTRTVASLYDLAGVVRDYTTPSRGSPALDREKENQACLLRWTHGWHARHIAEAMGLAIAANTDTWVENIMEALDGCTTRSDWNAQNRFLRNTNTPAGLAQDTVAGPNPHGEFRRTARQNAIIQAVLSPELRRGGRITAKAGKNKTSTELAAAADAILAREKRLKLYPGITFGKLFPQQITLLLSELGDLIDWPGKGKAAGIRDLSDEEKAKIDAEILRRCQLVAIAQIEEGREPKPPWGLYAEIERAVWLTTECCGPDGKETMERFGYAELTRGYASELCVRAGIFKATQQSVEEQIADLANQQAVRNAITAAGGDTDIRRLATATRLSMEVVSGILDVLGYVPVSVELAAIRAIILPLHDDQKLTPAQMWDQTPSLQALMPDRKTGAIKIRQLLMSSVPRRVPWTEATQRVERRIPLVASKLKGVFLSYLRDRDQQWLERVRGNVRRVASATEPTPWTVEELATAMQETPEFMGRVIALLATETPQLVAISESARGRQVIVIPPSGLRWILGGGETVEGDVG